MISQAFWRIRLSIRVDIPVSVTPVMMNVVRQGHTAGAESGQEQREYQRVPSSHRLATRCRTPCFIGVQNGIMPPAGIDTGRNKRVHDTDIKLITSPRRDEL